jgi:hypothetical protein
MCAAGGEELLLQTDNDNVSALVSAIRYKHTHIVSYLVPLSSKQLFFRTMSMSLLVSTGPSEKGMRR